MHGVRGGRTHVREFEQFAVEFATVGGNYSDEVKFEGAIRNYFSQRYDERSYTSSSQVSSDSSKAGRIQPMHRRPNRQSPVVSMSDFRILWEVVYQLSIHCQSVATACRIETGSASTSETALAGERTAVGRSPKRPRNVERGGTNWAVEIQDRDRSCPADDSRYWTENDDEPVTTRVRATSMIDPIRMSTIGLFGNTRAVRFANSTTAHIIY